MYVYRNYNILILFWYALKAKNINRLNVDNFNPSLVMTIKVQSKSYAFFYLHVIVIEVVYNASNDLFFNEAQIN